MNLDNMHIAIKQEYAFGMLFVSFSDGTKEMYNAFALGCEWFKTDNDTFYRIHGFNFNPHNIPVLYEQCRKAVYPNDK